MIVKALALDCTRKAIAGRSSPTDAMIADDMARAARLFQFAPYPG
jgi:hypothetical protein